MSIEIKNDLTETEYEIWQYMWRAMTAEELVELTKYDIDLINRFIVNAMEKGYIKLSFKDEMDFFIF
jgi:predicted HTH transcriptional regulator